MEKEPSRFHGTWTYQVVHITDMANGVGTSETLNKLGEEGWEAISIIQIPGRTGYGVFLKGKIT
jgi:hypothetical protein